MRFASARPLYLVPQVGYYQIAIVANGRTYTSHFPLHFDVSRTAAFLPLQTMSAVGEAGGGMDDRFTQIRFVDVAFARLDAHYFSHFLQLAHAR